jgi:hypothetical protein
VRARWSGLILLALVVATSGCSMFDRWVWNYGAADYQTAERYMRSSGRDLLIYYKDPSYGADRSVDRALKSDEVRDRLDAYIVCRLYLSYEPDRRYVAQFGVERAPALIVVRQDGTHHEEVGPVDAQDVVALLDRAAGPGERARANPHIPRTPHYHWTSDLDEALAQAARTDRPVLLLLTRYWSWDDGRLEDLLESREVYRICEAWVHCHQTEYWPFEREAAARYQIAELPALIVILPDGSEFVLEEPDRPGEVARFLMNAASAWADRVPDPADLGDASDVRDTSETD